MYIFANRLLMLLAAGLIASSAMAQVPTDWLKLGMAPSAIPGGKPYTVYYSNSVTRSGDLAVAHVYAQLQGAKGSEVDTFRFDCQKNLWSYVKWVSYKTHDIKGEVEFFSKEDDPDLKHYQNKPVPTKEIKSGQDAGYGIMALSLFKKLKEIACAAPGSPSKLSPIPSGEATEMGRRAGIMQRALRGMSGNNPDLDKLMSAVEHLQNQYASVPEFKKAFNTSYEESMKSLDDHAAAKAALSIYQQLPK
jgi:hypothetical protein